MPRQRRACARRTASAYAVSCSTARARGDATEESDVDLLVVLDGPIENSYQETKHAGAGWGDLIERYGLFFSFQPYAAAEYEAKRSPFMRNVHAEGIRLTDALFAEEAL